MSNKQIQHLEELLSHLEIASSESDKHDSGGSQAWNKALFTEELSKAQVYVTAIKKIFDQLGTNYIKTYEHTGDMGKVNVVDIALEAIEGYPYNSAKHDLIRDIKGAIFALQEGYDEQVEDADIPIPPQEFSFIADGKLREIIKNNYLEAYGCLMRKCHKATIIIAGGTIEAILLDALIKDQAKALASTKAPSGNKLDKWVLHDLIEVAVDLKLVLDGVSKLSHGIRDFRNLIHPGKELRANLKVGHEEAKISIEVLNMLIRDLS